MTSRLSRRLTFQSLAMKSAESQSSNSGCEGRFALTAEILRCADEAFAEAELPEMVHCHARGQRIVGGGQPLREAKPVARHALGERREDKPGSPGRHAHPVDRTRRDSAQRSSGVSPSSPP